MMTYTNTQKGFTIIELVIVIAVLGIIGLAMVSYFGSSASNGAKALSLYESSHRLINNFQTLSAVTNTTNSVSDSPLPVTGKNITDVMIEGKSLLKDEYKRYWIELDLHPMSEIIFKDASNNYFIEKSQFTLSGGGSNPVQVQFVNIPDEIVINVVSKYINPTTQLNDAGDSSYPTIKYGIKTTDNTRTLTILKK